MTDNFLNHINIRPMVSSDAEALADVFELWNRSMDEFEQYYLDQLLGKRTVLIARHSTEGITGYTTILWASTYTRFWQRKIPEIADINVLLQHRRRGIGTALVKASEVQARQQGRTATGISLLQDDTTIAIHRLCSVIGYAPDSAAIGPDNTLRLVKSI